MTLSETTDLLPGRNENDRLVRRPFWNSRNLTVVLVLGVGLLYFGISNHRSHHDLAPLVSSSRDECGDEEPMLPMFRPTCTYYQGAAMDDEETWKPPSLIQTSKGEPSQQWSQRPCYESKYKHKKHEPWIHRFRHHGHSSKLASEADLNAYGAPDAILTIQRQTDAFADRTVDILGFGGAFTEASARNYRSLSDAGRQTLMELLFGSSGLGYSLGRVHMNSCDFSVESYSFDDTDQDFDLNDFDTGVRHDVEVGMVEMIQKAQQLFQQAWGDEDTHFKMYTSPWSPPAWMKRPNWRDAPGALHAENMTGSAPGDVENTCLLEGVGPESRYAQAWALYFSKFITAYKNLGISLFAVTVQNEPEFPAPWEACAYTPTTEGMFIANHLGPQLQQDHPGVKIIMFDHNKDHVNRWVHSILNATNPAKPYVSGTGYHWYAGGMNRLLDGAVGSPNMHRLLSDLEELGVKQDHLILGSESCHCPYTGYAGGDIAIYWARAERYAHTILADLAAGSNGWVDWNLLLDSIGGPNHLGNLCDSPILAVPHRAKQDPENYTSIPPTLDFEHAGLPFGPNHGDERTRAELNALGFPAKFLDAGLVVQPLYFYMGHISRYVRPGSRAILGLVKAANTTIVNEATGRPVQTFRPEGSVVAGGGINDLAQGGIEVTVWPCEGSTRQVFKWNDQKQLEVFGHDWKDNPTTSCLARIPDQWFRGLTLTDCKDPKNFGTFEFNSDGEFELITMQEDQEDGENDDGEDEKRCLVIQKLKNNGGAYGLEGGSQVTLGACGSAESKWTLYPESGEIVSSFLGEEVCMTTGWPFLQMGAFHTPNGESEYTVVILNESEDSANYVLKDSIDGDILSGSIPPHSIQTVLVD